MGNDGREREATVPPADCLKPWKTGTKWKLHLRGEAGYAAGQAIC